MRINSLRAVDPVREGVRTASRASLVLLGAGPALGWALVAWVHLSLPGLLLRWSVLAFALVGVCWLFALALTATAVALLMRRLPGRQVAVGFVAFVLVIVATALAVPWPPASARATFDGEDFGRAATLARSGELGPALEDSYYGAELPPELDHISGNGRIAVIGRNNGQPVLFVPAVTGLVDDAVGWAHLVGPPEPGLDLDGFGNPNVRLRDDLGGGWWWIE